MANETVVEAGAAPAGDQAATKPDAGQAVPAPTTKADPAQEGAITTPAPNGDPSGQPAFDVQKSYDELRKQFTKTSMDYAKDRKVWNQTLSELQTLKTSQAKLAEVLVKATEVPVDPAQFMADLQKNGPAALNDYIGKHVSNATKELQSAYVEQANRALSLEIKLEKMARRHDAQNYPDWDKLEPIMNEIADPDNPEQSPIDWNQPVGLVYDALYKLARSRSSEEAVKAAEAFGKKQAEAQLGKEAQAAVPGGGKGGSITPDPRKMSAKDLRQHFINQGMIEEA